jgi:hypothetical protein
MADPARRGFQSPSPRRNAADALAAWERQPEGTLLTNGQGYVLATTEPVRVPPRWWQTSPEEIEAYLRHTGRSDT